ncbi:MAG TPA: hypothetical protein VHO70_18190 [Chitinispirillaceae bacterium]|nr:hypothetical protein [Chitinispirillaceae bacterium]
MERDARRLEERERLVRSMAVKLAKGKGIELIAASRRKKRSRTIIYISIPVILFFITGIILFVKTPGTTSMTIKADRPVVERISLLQLLHQDLENKKITVNQYAFYLRDILIRYDSLPQHYHPDRPSVLTEDIYDSLCAVWPKIDLKIRAQLLKELPKMDTYLKEFHYKIANRAE